MTRSLPALLLLACLAARRSAACKKEEAPKAAGRRAAGRADHRRRRTPGRPTCSDVVKRNMDGVTNSPFVYYLPADSDRRLPGRSTTASSRRSKSDRRARHPGRQHAGVRLAGLGARWPTWSSPRSPTSPPDTMKGVKVLFIGSAADSERVKAAVDAVRRQLRVRRSQVSPTRRAAQRGRASRRPRGRRVANRHVPARSTSSASTATSASRPARTRRSPRARRST